MKLTRLSCFLVSLSVLRIVAPVAAEPQPLPTMTEIHGLYEDKLYPEALRAITRVATMRQIPPEYDKYELLTLKAECHLRLRQQPLAVDTFEKAADVTENERDRAIAAATALLIKKSTGFAYRPKSGGDGKPPQPIDVIEAEPRKQALSALFEDEWKGKQATLKRARQSGSLPQLSSAIEEVTELRLLELAATGEDARCKAAVQEIVDSAVAAIAAALPKMDAAVREIDRRALEVIVNEKEGWSGPRGLTSNDMQELRGIMTSCEKAAQVIDGLARIADVPAKTRLMDLRRDCHLVHESAKTTLGRDYRRVKRPNRG